MNTFNSISSIPFLKRSVSFLFLFLFHTLQAQEINQSTQTNGSRLNNIITAVPFLLITPDARAAGMGEAGVAMQPDGNSMSINPSKLAFIKAPYGFAVSYSPWLKSLTPDINLAYVSGFYQLDEERKLGSSLRYFSLGKVPLKDDSMQDLGIYNPNEFAFDVTYAQKFGEEFALGTAVRFIYSNLVSGQFSTDQQTKAGKAFAVDVSAHYKKQTVWLGKDAIFALGTNFSNIGTKLGYVKEGTKYFLPTNMKLGMATTLIIDDFSQFSFALDVNKLLVPTQPTRTANGNISAGKDPDLSVPAGIFSSFNDAPGGLSEELKEINIATGLEYLYNQQFAIRTGYFYEAPEKGDRRYLTLGAGLAYKNLNLDLSYVLGNVQQNPMANTLRYTLLFNFQKTVK